MVNGAGITGVVEIDTRVAEKVVSGLDVEEAMLAVSVVMVSEAVFSVSESEQFSIHASYSSCDIL